MTAALRYTYTTNDSSGRFFDVYLRPVDADGTYRLESVSGQIGQSGNESVIASDIATLSAAIRKFDKVVADTMNKGFMVMDAQWVGGGPPRLFRYLQPKSLRTKAFALLAPYQTHSAVFDALSLLTYSNDRRTFDLTLESPLLPCVAVLAIRGCGSLHEGFKNDLLGDKDLRRLARESTGDARSVYQLFDLIDAPIRDFAAAIMGANARPSLTL